MQVMLRVYRVFRQYAVIDVKGESNLKVCIVITVKGVYRMRLWVYRMLRVCKEGVCGCIEC